jgi:hypothetical protein
MQNQTEYQYEIEDDNENDEPRVIINFIKICRLCDNIKLRHQLSEYKICTFCKNEIFALRNGFKLANIARYYKKQKRREAKQKIVLALFNLHIGIGAGIHETVLNYIL